MEFVGSRGAIGDLAVVKCVADRTIDRIMSEKNSTTQGHKSAGK